MKMVLNVTEVVTRAIDANSFILETPLGLLQLLVEMLQEVVEWAEVVLFVDFGMLVMIILTDLSISFRENREDRLVVGEGVDLVLLIPIIHLRRRDGIQEEDLIIMHRARARVRAGR
jgi:hypothetical protein